MLSQRDLYDWLSPNIRSINECSVPNKNYCIVCSLPTFYEKTIND